MTDRRDFLKYSGLSAGATALGLSNPAKAGADTEVSEYEWRYGYQMGTRPIEVSSLNDAILGADEGAVYANRNMHEFSYVSWNFPPSPNPFSFGERNEPMPRSIMRHLHETNTDAFIVVKNGEIVHEYYAKGMHVATKHATYSTGKAYTTASYATELLGAIDQKVADIIPELEGSYIGEQTVRSVVDMRIPIKWDFNYDDPDTEINRFGAQFGWALTSVDDGLIQFLRGLEPSEEADPSEDPVKRMTTYVDSNTVLAGMIGRRIAGIHGYMGMKRFYDALGFERVSGTVAGFHQDPSSDGGHYMTLRDFVKLPFAMANGGMIDGRQAVPTEYIEDVLTDDPLKRDAWSRSIGTSLYPKAIHYTNKWYGVSSDAAFGAGSYGQYIFFNRARNLVIGKFSTFPKSSDPDFVRRDNVFLAGLIDTL